MPLLRVLAANKMVSDANIRAFFMDLNTQNRTNYSMTDQREYEFSIALSKELFFLDNTTNNSLNFEFISKGK